VRRSVSVPAHERAAVIAGAGVGWIAQIICSDDLASGQLVSSDLGGWFPPGDEHHVLFPSNPSLSPKVRAFVDFLVEHFGALRRGASNEATLARPAPAPTGKAACKYLICMALSMIAGANLGAPSTIQPVSAGFTGGGEKGGAA
jgi:hypothetical protein